MKLTLLFSGEVWYNKVTYKLSRVHFMNVLIDGLNINYTDEGQGAPVLLLHGWGSSNEVYKGFINTLKSRCRLVAPDFPGCGKSDTMSEPWDLQRY